MVASSVIAVVTPVLAGDVINAITAAQPDAGRVVVILIALVIAGLAVLDAGFSLVQRFLSARIGEGIIFDLRTQVYDHVQRMPLQFFTRTQTGALVSRLNNDVIGAQQAFTSTLSGTVGNVIALVLTAGVMFSLSWQVTALSLVLVPAFLLPARLVGRRLAEITRESYQLDATDERHHDRALRRGRRAAGQALRPARRSRPSGSPAGPPGSATSACSRPCTARRSSSR